MDKFKRQQDLTLKCNWPMPEPVFESTNSNSVIISTDSFENNAGIFRYNLYENQLEKILEYDIGMHVEDHAHFIDYDNETLHIIVYDEKLHIIIDLKTKKIINQQEFVNRCPNTKCVQISSKSVNQIHIIQNDFIHYTFDNTNNKFTEVNSSDGLTEINSPKLLYIQMKKQMMILGGSYTDNIYHCKITEPFEWKLMSNVKMPHLCNKYGYVPNYDILSFCDVIIAFYFDGICCNDIWCLDLLNYKWFKSKYSVPKSIATSDEYSYFIKNINTSDIHVLDFVNKQHFIINAHNIFSNEMIKQRRKHFNTLIFGFIGNEEINAVLNIPWTLKQLILLYFPLFIDKK